MSTQGFNESSTTVELELNSGDVLVADIVVETHPVLPGRVLVSGKDVSRVWMDSRFVPKIACWFDDPPTLTNLLSRA